MTPFELGTLTDADSGAPVTIPAFRAIAAALAALPPRGVGILWGSGVAEEIPAYARSVGQRYPAQTLIGGKRFSVRDYAARHAPMPARSRYKVESFLSRPVPRTISIRRLEELVLFHDIFDFAAEASWKTLNDYIRPLYRATRRVKDGTESDIERYLLPFRSASLEGDLVLRTNRDFFTFEFLIALWTYYHTPAISRLLIMAEGQEPSWSKSPSIVLSKERDYISVEKLLSDTAEYFDRSRGIIGSAFQIWKKSRPPSEQSLLDSNRIGETAADQFLAAFASTDIDDDVPAIRLTVPPQKAAPIRFRSEGGLIDVVTDREMIANAPRAIGASHTCIHAIDDLINYGNMSNTLPSVLGRLNRLRSMLVKVSLDDYDDGLIVQIGTELGGIADRINGSPDLVSDDTLAEAGTMYAVVGRFLTQFSAWNEYETQARKFEVSDTAPDIAKEVLDLIRLKQDIITGKAHNRIDEYVDGFDTSASLQAIETGAVVTAENLLAQAAGQLAEAAQEANEPVSREFVESLSQSDELQAAKWLSENDDLATEFAEKGNLSWLTNFMSAMKRPRPLR